MLLLVIRSVTKRSRFTAVLLKKKPYLEGKGTNFYY